jgi:hypothetical protein
VPYYLSPYIGAGIRGNPFRPTGSDQAGWSAIDLRADKGVTLDGGGFKYALLWLPPGTTEDNALIKIGLDKLETVTTQIKNAILAKAPGLNFTNDVTLQDLFESMLVTPPAGWWNAIRPANGRVEAWLGGQRIVDFPVVAGGSISDNFNRANETPAAAPWTKLAGGTGTINLTSNAITKITAGDAFFYYNNAAGWNADHSSSWLYATAITINDWGPAVRIGVDGFSGYCYDGATTEPQLFKFVAGAFTTVETASSTTVGQTVKLDVAGSTLTYSRNGTPDANSPGSDTSLTTAGNGPGVFYYQNSGSLDDFLATGEVSAAGGTVNQSIPAMRVPNVFIV